MAIEATPVAGPAARLFPGRADCGDKFGKRPAATPRATARQQKRTLIVVAVAIIPIVIWYLFDVVLIAFGAVILAMLVRLGAQPLMRFLSAPGPLALAISGLLILLVIGGTGYLFGSQIAHEFQDVVHRAVSAASTIQASLKGSELGNFLLSHVSGSDVSVTAVVSNFLKISTDFLEAVVIW